jgi:hypothetical protein
MKNYLITEKQFKKIVEQVEDGEDTKKPTKDSSSIFGNLLGGKEVEMDSEDDELSGGDPVQQFFDSLK